VIDIWSHLSDSKGETLEKKKENLHICTKEELHAISSLAFRSYLKPYIAIDTWSRVSVSKGGSRVSVSKGETHEKEGTIFHICTKGELHRISPLLSPS